MPEEVDLGKRRCVALDRFSIRRRAEALASADTRTLKRALYGETQTLYAPNAAGPAETRDGVCLVL